jgi:hypothetical protein
MLVGFSLFLAALAGAATVAYRTPVEIEVTGFKAKIDDGRVVCTWRRYKRDDFLSYKLVKSSAKEAPLFPEDPAIFSSEQAGDTRFEDGKLSEGTWRYRLVIVTRFNDRWVSPSAAVVVDSEALKRAAPTAADFEGP